MPRALIAAVWAGVDALERGAAPLGGARLRAGTPVEVVRRQLGHATPNLTLALYGAFLPTAADRAHWRDQVATHEAKRREGGLRA
ncbi:MAG: hypothetical protein ACREOC_13740 [Gemmatimonadales bacterium]